MSFLEAVALGILQGLTEFLPVSSSGHLVLGQRLLGLREPHLLFDIAVHVGTLAAVLVVFRSDIMQMIRGLFPGEEGRPGRRLIWLVALGSLPTAVVGLLGKDLFTAMFSSLLVVGSALLVTGCLLMATRLGSGGRRGAEQAGLWRPLAVGLAQGLAITPGISRSGATIGIGLLLGLERRFIAHYSFLLSVPAILGALALEASHAASAPRLPLAPMLAGGLAAGLTGYFALRALLRVVQQGRLHWFAFYCWALGAAALAWQVSGG